MKTLFLINLYSSDRCFYKYSGIYIYIYANATDLQRLQKLIDGRWKVPVYVYVNTIELQRLQLTKLIDEKLYRCNKP